MIPAITPPTDNLYKFISLFGLTIFLFATYNLGIVYDQSTVSKMKIEDLRAEVEKKIYQTSGRHETDGQPINDRFRPAKISMLGAELDQLTSDINKKLDPIESIELCSKISKLNVKLDALALKFWTYVVVVLFGLTVMIFGFLRWFIREQKLRDQMLIIEYDLKQKQKNKKAKKIKTTKLVPEENIQANQEIDFQKFTSTNN